MLCFVGPAPLNLIRFHDKGGMGEGGWLCPCRSLPFLVLDHGCFGFETEANCLSVITG